MSGIYIQGMEMPSECLYCPCYDLGRERCDVTCKRQYSHAKPSDCPLISVPEHGRLIDADAAVANRNDYINWYYDLDDLLDYLEECPTIIPADKEETE